MSRLRAAHVDAALLFVTCSIAFSAFHQTFLGWTYLVVGIVGLALGMLASALVIQLRQPFVLAAALLVGEFFLLGGVVTLHGLGVGYLAPTPKVWASLADVSVHGWKQLLTSLPPIDGTELVVLPYLLGLVSGCAGLLLATRVRWAPAPVLVPVALLALVILLGVQSPRGTAAVAAAFAVAAIAWLALRARRVSTSQLTASGRTARRRLIAAGLCLGAAATGLVVGGHLPAVKAHRVVLRASVVPPFDVGQYPSPLVAFRRFTRGYGATKANNDDELYDKSLFKVTGVPEGTRVRLAALDNYDSNVWGAGNVAGTAGQPLVADDDNTFQKVSRVIDNPTVGAPVTGRVQVLSDELGPSWVWLPTVGDLTGITFHVPGEFEGSSDFRYNLVSSTGVMPDGMTSGMSYSFDAVQPSDALSARTRLAQGALPGVASQGQFSRLATTWAGGADSPLKQVEGVAAYLKRNGHFTDGEGSFHDFTAGHSIGRLVSFVGSTGELAGDDEQYAAVMALMSNELGVPARVVLGAQVPFGRVIKGKDIHAWVELQATDGNWKTLPQSSFMSRRPPKQQTQIPQDTVPASVIPPPVPVHPPATAGEPLVNNINHRNADAKKKHHSVLDPPVWALVILKYVGLPVLVLLILGSAIVGAKRLRRVLRRRRASPTRRLAYAWRELLDQARDFGQPTLRGATRREQAAALSIPELASSAGLADAIMFAAESPSDAVVAAYWSHVDDQRRAISRSHGRWTRVRAALNVSTFRFRGPTIS